MTDQAREAVELLLKNRQSDNRQSYLVRGRRYRTTLRQRSLQALGGADEPLGRRLDRVRPREPSTIFGVEMGLREIAPPLEQIAEARQKILAKSGKALATHSCRPSGHRIAEVNGRVNDAVQPTRYRQPLFFTSIEMRRRP